MGERAQIQPSKTQALRDILAPDLDVMFVGINPGLVSAARGHHFSGPGNRFWAALHRGGFTIEPLRPETDASLLDLGIGLTNLVDRATARADMLAPAELREGEGHLVRKVEQWRPRWVAIVGITAFRAAFGQPRARVGAWPEKIAGARLWILPNPSGLNAHYSVAALGTCFGAFRAAMDADEAGVRARKDR